MINLIIWCLYISGLTIIITQSGILAKFRDWITKKSPFFGKMVKCSMCLGFWLGLLSPFIPYPGINFFVSAVLGSVVSFTLFAILWKLALRDLEV